MRERMRDYMYAYISAPPPPSVDAAHLAVHACVRDNARVQEEREQKPTDLSVSLYPNYPISPLLVSHRKCAEGSRHKRLRLGKGARIINHTYISHLFKERGAALGLTEAERRLL